MGVDTGYMEAVRVKHVHPSKNEPDPCHVKPHDREGRMPTDQLLSPDIRLVDKVSLLTRTGMSPVQVEAMNMGSLCLQ